MRIAANSPNGKIFGVVERNQFRPLLVGGVETHDLRQVISQVTAGRLDHGAPVALDKSVAAPVGPLAKNVVSVGKNYHDHAQEFARSGFDQSGDKLEVPEAQSVFTKAVTSLADPGQGLPASSDPTNSDRLRRRTWCRYRPPCKKREDRGGRLRRRVRLYDRQ